MNTPQEQEMPQTAAPAAKPGIFTPKPSYGVLVWAAAVAFSVFSGPHVYPIQIVSILSSIAACVWWFVISRTHGRRELVRRVFGYVAFGFGSMLPVSAADIVLMGAAHKVPLIHTLALFIGCFAAGAVLVAGAFYMVFRRHENTPS